MSLKGSAKGGRSGGLGRAATVERKTKETRIRLEVNLDGAGRFKGSSGLPFFDHMLELFAKHGRLDIALTMTGDLPVDSHHSVEDVGIALGQALEKAAGDKAGIRRFGQAAVPMEEALVSVMLDFCGRAYLFWGVPELQRQMIGDYATELTEDFFRAMCNKAGLTVHFECSRGRNSHHIIEAAFKAFARALRDALAPDTRAQGEIPSTKGLL